MRGVFSNHEIYERDETGWVRDTGEKGNGLWVLFGEMRFLLFLRGRYRWGMLRMILCFGVLVGSVFGETYELGEESKRQEGVLVGKVTRHDWKSEVFEGTLRQYYVYVPAQYDAAKPANVLVFQDGHAYVQEDGQIRATVVMDNLIAKKEMPVTVGIFLNPGIFTEKIEGKQGWKTKKGSNRSVEYDTLSSKYAEFLEKEILPEVGKDLNLTKEAKGRAICGMSSGGICAFTVAWERPDLFQKVISHIGSFTNIRGGHVYPALIRKEKKREMRVFLQDGENDLDNQHGNWWLSNLQMEKALKFRGYDYKFVGGEEGHNGKHGGVVFPETLRWIWRE
ncbi:MAG: enterochelin esterase family protein [Akkermansiaceae bacterium]